MKKLIVVLMVLGMVGAAAPAQAHHNDARFRNRIGTLERRVNGLSNALAYFMNCNDTVLGVSQYFGYVYDDGFDFISETALDIDNSSFADAFVAVINDSCVASGRFRVLKIAPQMR